MFYVIFNNSLLISKNKNILEKYYGNVSNLPEDYETNKYIVSNNELVLNPNFEIEKQNAQKEQLSKMCLTRADVERAIYKTKGMNFDDILEFVSSNKPDNLDLKALKIELNANYFYRGNSYVDVIGSLLGFNKEQLDNFFKDGNYEHLLVL